MKLSSVFGIVGAAMMAASPVLSVESMSSQALAGGLSLVGASLFVFWMEWLFE